MFKYLAVTDSPSHVRFVPNPALAHETVALGAVGIDRATGRPATIYTPPEDIVYPRVDDPSMDDYAEKTLAAFLAENGIAVR